MLRQTESDEAAYLPLQPTTQSSGFYAVDQKRSEPKRGAVTETGRALTVAVAVKPDRVESLEILLTSIGNDIKGNPHIRFDELETVHFMRWVVVRRQPGLSADYLLLETNFDGSLDEHLDDLIAASGNTLHVIYGHCQGYALTGPTLALSERVALCSFLKARAISETAFYVANRGKTSARIRLEAACYQSIQRLLDAEGRALKNLTPKAIYERIRVHLERDELLEKLTAPEPVAPARLGLWRVAAKVLPLLVLPLLSLPVALPLLLVKELTDEAWDPKSFDDRMQRVSTLAAQEDRKVQNQLTHVVRVKLGWFRGFVLKRVLTVIDRLARYYFNQGDLGGIPTIHFARWALLESDTLVFFSNYDGSWENYLGDFIDRAAVGLTSVWSNTELFPRTSFLLRKGARDEERFKSWTRAHQHYTQVWYSAYPTLSVQNIRNNAAIAHGVTSRLTDETSIRQFLALL